MKLLITGGGTGGHVFPAICVAQECLKNITGARVLFVGASGGMEERIVPKYGFQLRTIKVKGLRGKNLFEMTKNLFLFTTVIPLCMQIIAEEKPDAVIGFGGYASGPIVFAGWLLHCITAIHEQNAIPGLTNRVLGYFVDRVFISFEKSAEYFNIEKVINTGMPVREVILKANSQKRSNDRFTILVIGGSQGARFINRVVTEMVERNDEIRKYVSIIHQTGAQDKEYVENRYRNAGAIAEVYDFIDDMASVYARSDLVIARAGASTLAELSAAGKPSILIPYPYAAGDHQRFNAETFSTAGAGEVILESKLTPELLADKVRNLMASPERLEDMSQKARLLFKRDAAKNIVESIRELVEERRQNV